MNKDPRRLYESDSAKREQSSTSKRSARANPPIPRKSVPYGNRVPVQRPAAPAQGRSEVRPPSGASAGGERPRQYQPERRTQAQSASPAPRQGQAPQRNPADVRRAPERAAEPVKLETRYSSLNSAQPPTPERQLQYQWAKPPQAQQRATYVAKTDTPRRAPAAVPQARAQASSERAGLAARPPASPCREPANQEIQQRKQQAASPPPPNIKDNRQPANKAFVPTSKTPKKAGTLFNLFADNTGKAEKIRKKQENTHSSTKEDAAVTPKNGKTGKKTKMTKTAKRAVVINLFKSLFILGCLGVVMLCVSLIYLARYVVSDADTNEFALDLSSLIDAQTGYLMAYDPETGEEIEYQMLMQGSNSSWAPIGEIPEMMQNAIIAVEDASFYEHKGFNIKRTVRAALNEVFKFEKQSGGSTIDQQLVKNITGEDIVVSADGSAVPGYQRKIKEIYRAYLMDKNYPKKIILEAYLNMVPLSGVIVGVKAGSREYFNKELSELTIGQYAMIAGIIRSPDAYNPWINPNDCRARRNDVLAAMYKEGYITLEEREFFYSTELELYDYNRPDAEVPVVGATSSYFADAVMEDVIKVLVERGIASNEAEATIMYLTSGWKIYTTVNLTVQEKMEEVYEQGHEGEGAIFPSTVFAEAYFNSSGKEVLTEEEKANATVGTVFPESAMVVMDYEGRLMGIVGGIGERKIALGLNRATQSPRPVGSTIKPIIPYALALEAGIINYSSMVSDAPSRPGDPVKRDPESNTIINEWPQNIYHYGGIGEPVMIWEALARSLNTVPVILGDIITEPAMFDYAMNTLQFSTLTPDDAFVAPMTLGALNQGITMYELAAAYQVIGNGGVYHTPRTFDKIVDANGNVVVDMKNDPGLVIQAMSSETAYILNRLMANVLIEPYGTAKGMKLSYLDSIAKTGSTDDYKDRLFVGLTPYYVSAVWWGYDLNHKLDFSTNIRTNPPPLAWKTIMEAVQANLPEKDWPFSPDDMPEIDVLTYCNESGGLAVEGCAETGQGYYTRDNHPPDCNIHSTTEVDYSDGSDEESE